MKRADASVAHGFNLLKMFKTVLSSLVLKSIFSSADLTAASEYIDYCDGWIQRLNGLAKKLVELDNELIGEVEFADEDKGIKSKVIEFHNGSKIIVLSSNPKAFRSKGGKIVWDEAAHHDNDEKMWAAAKPAAMWGLSNPHFKHSQRR